MEISPYPQNIKTFLAIKDNSTRLFFALPESNYIGGLI